MQPGENEMQEAMRHHLAGRLGEAEAIYRRVLAANPNDIDALFNLANVLSATGREDQGVAGFLRVIQLKPDCAQAFNNMGNVLARQGKLDQAAAAYQQAIRFKPDYADAHYNFGNALRDLNRVDQAIAAYERAIRLKSDFAQAYSNLGNSLVLRDRYEEAIVVCRRLIELRPDWPEGHFNLGNALQSTRRSRAAIASHLRAIQLKPDFVEAHSNLGSALRDEGDFDASVAACRRAIELEANCADAYNNLGNTLKDMARHEAAAAAYRRAVELRPGDASFHSNLIHAMQYNRVCGRAELREEVQRWAARHAEPCKPRIQPHTNDRAAGRRLRIGYVSGDLCEHVVGRNILPLFRERDAKSFELFCYSNGSPADGHGKMFRSLCDGWREISGVADDAAAKMIRDDGIDILVDLSLHSAMNRLPIFAQKPAPVQATFAGYPGTTGLSAIEYRLTDPYLDPPGHGDDFYVERPLRLPHSFWCYDPEAMGVARGFEVAPLPALGNGRVTFGCLNNFCKMNAAVLETWAKVLLASAGSRLLLMAPRGECRAELLAHFEELGVEAARIEFVERQDRAAYFRGYDRIDIGLDTFPYGGHTTSLDSLWMGVPVVSLVGATAVGRAGLSILSNAGLPELAADDTGEFVRRASELAADLPRLEKMRRGLRQRMLDSPLTDARGFAAAVESAFRRMWSEWCSKGD